MIPQPRKTKKQAAQINNKKQLKGMTIVRETALPYQSGVGYNLNMNEQIKLAKRLQAIAQTGLAFSKDVFDRERYEQVQQISAELISPHTPFSTSEVVDIFAGEGGYTTPKIGVRAAIVRKNDENGSAELLLVQELADNNLWTMPGGFVDAGDSPREAVEREAWEETGYQTHARKLIGVFDRNRLFDGDFRFFELHTLLFLCEITGGEAQTSIETGTSRFFRFDEIPALSNRRTLPLYITLALKHFDNFGLPTEFN